LRWYGHVLRKENNDWVKRCSENVVEGARPRGRPTRTWSEVVQKDNQAYKLNREDDMDRSRWRKLVGMIDDQDRHKRVNIFFWYWLTWVVLGIGLSSHILDNVR